MQYKTLGDTGLLVSTLCFGAMTFHGIKLTDAQMKELDEVSALSPEYPGWMFLFQSADRLDPKVDRFARMQETCATAK